MSRHEWPGGLVNNGFGISCPLTTVHLKQSRFRYQEVGDQRLPLKARAWSRVESAPSATLLGPPSPFFLLSREISRQDDSVERFFVKADRISREISRQGGSVERFLVKTIQSRDFWPRRFSREISGRDDLLERFFVKADQSRNFSSRQRSTAHQQPFLFSIITSKLRI